MNWSLWAWWIQRSRGNKGLYLVTPFLGWTEKYAAVYVNTLLKCLETTGGLRGRRKIAHRLHDERQNEIINFYFLYMENSEVRIEYILLVKYDLY